MQPPAPFHSPWQARLFALIMEIKTRQGINEADWRTRVAKAAEDCRAEPTDESLIWKIWLTSFEGLLRDSAMAAPMQLGSVLQAVRVSTEIEPDAVEPNARLVAQALGRR
jgi:hypothetical protein